MPRILLASFTLSFNSKLSDLGSSGEITRRVDGKYIRLLKTNKAFGLDKISARLLKDSVDVITPYLTNLQINIVNYLHECKLQ